MCNPKIIMPLPAIFVRYDIFDLRNTPIKDTEAPKRMKTSEKPTIKKILEKIIFFDAAFSSSLTNFSRLIPVIKDRYPGTMGNTQGEKKDSIPASNAINDSTIMQVSYRILL